MSNVRVATGQQRIEPSGKTVDSLVQQTAEGIAIKPLYTEAKCDNRQVPFLVCRPTDRGPRATMYMDHPSVCWFFNSKRVQRFLSP